MTFVKLGKNILVGAMLAILFIFVATSVSASANLNRPFQDDKQDEKKNPPPPKKSTTPPPKKNSSTPPKKGTPPPSDKSAPPPKSSGNQPPNDKSPGPPPAGSGQATGNPATGSNPANNPPKGNGNPNSTNRGNGSSNSSNLSGVHPPPPNTHQVTTSSGAVAYVRPNGGIARINNHGTVIETGIHGERTVIAPLPGGGRVVVNSPRGGYVQHSFVRNNQTLISRTYVVNNRTFVRVYQPIRYQGVVYYRYVPAFYYRPAFYGWFFSPWQVGIGFSWGWGSWFGFYGGYFQPYPVYNGPNYWLTDYLISQNLQLAYENQQLMQANGQYTAPPPDDGSQPPPVELSPEVKQAIADEVQRQLQQAQADAAQAATGGGAPPSASANQIPAALDPSMSTFIVTSNLEVTDNGQPCEITPGDVIVRIDDTPGPDGAVAVKVTNSKPGDCRAGALPRVQVSDLQEMYNQFRAQIDAGTQQLAASQGKNGMPAAPAGSTTTIQGPGQAPPPDPNAATIIQQQQTDADAVENDVKKQTASPGQPNQ